MIGRGGFDAAFPSWLSSRVFGRIDYCCGAAVEQKARDDQAWVSSPVLDRNPGGQRLLCPLSLEGQKPSIRLHRLNLQ